MKQEFIGFILSHLGQKEKPISSISLKKPAVEWTDSHTNFQVKYGAAGG